MRTKTSDRTRVRFEIATVDAAAPFFPDTIAYWLEDDLGNRVSLLFAASDSPLRLAGRVLENVGSLTEWSLARRDTAGVRHVVACGEDLESMATPFMPVRTSEQADRLRPLNEARRAAGFRRPTIVTDERVY
jgi:hypothetical protein